MVAKIHERGFTLLELLVATAISILVTGGAIAGFGTYNENQKLRQAALQLKSSLRLTQQKALSSQKPTSGCTRLDGYRVTFTTVTSYTVQAQCDNGTAAGDSLNFTLPDGVTFFPKPNSLLFRIVGAVDISADAPIVLHGSYRYYKVTIRQGGDISDDGFL